MRATLETILQDVRFALRAMRRSPWFALTAVLALALGMGASTAIFSVVNSVLLRPLPYRDSDRLMVILHRGNDPVAPANFLDWRGQSHSFAAIEAAEYWSPNVTGIDQAKRVTALRTTAGMFHLLGIEPLLGRTFAAGEDQPGNEHVVVLSYGLWLRRFGGDRGVIGRSVLLNSQPFTVIGVMPRGFRFAPFWATKAEMWAPLAFSPGKAASRDGESLRIFARLRDGVSLAAARAEMASLTAQLEQAYPGTNKDITVTPLKEKVVGDVRPALLVLLGAVGFLLLIACANVAHMLLARAAAREKEIAVRSALGARRRRLIRQLFTENLMLAVIGGGGGLAIAYGAVSLLHALAPAKLPRIDAVNMDGRVLLFCLGATLLTALLFGMAPALQTSVRDLGDSLKQGGHGATQGRHGTRLRAVLIASEFALALMLLIASGLMIRSFAALTSIDPGFNPHHVLSLEISLAGSREAAPAQRVAFYQQLLEQVRSLPGVVSAAGINHVPLAGDLWRLPLYVEGRPMPRPSDTLHATYRVVLPGYFHTMQLPLLRGRDVAAQDTLQSPAVIVVNQRLAQRMWPGEDALGKRVTLDNPGKDPTWLTVIGVVKDAKQDDWAAAPVPEMYLPLAQDSMYLSDSANFASFSFVIRASGDAAALAPSVISQVRVLDANVPVSQVVTLDDVVSEANSQPRFYVVLLGAFAAVALLLAAIGIYGVMSYAVSRRTHEIGLRVALGASRRDVLRLVVGQGMALAFTGAAAGLAGAFLLSRLMAKLLYGVRPTDPQTFAMVPLLLGLVALAANYLPARRAMRINPIIALRQE